MPTSMLDALADEAKAVTELGIAASRLAIEAVYRSRHLHLQIEQMAADERANEIPDAPGILPAAQIDGQGKEGSGEVAPGGATALRLAEPEQVGADVASGEQGSDAVCNDPGAAPDTPRTRKDKALDLYAAFPVGLNEIARSVGVSRSSIESYLTSARKACDRRVAKGDVLREENIVEQATAPARRQERPVPAALVEPERKPALTMEIDEDAKEGNLLALNLNRCTAAYRGQGIQLVRHELRLLLQMNDQQPKSPEEMLSYAGVLTQRRLQAEISKLNARLTLIGVEIHFDDVSYALRPLQVA